jgi:hypothetical protein
MLETCSKPQRIVIASITKIDILSKSSLIEKRGGGSVPTINLVVSGCIDG